MLHSLEDKLYQILTYNSISCVPNFYNWNVSRYRKLLEIITKFGDDDGKNPSRGNLNSMKVLFYLSSTEYLFLGLLWS